MIIELMPIQPEMHPEHIRHSQHPPKTKTIHTKTSMKINILLLYF